jgi:hypothetical protein
VAHIDSILGAQRRGNRRREVLEPIRETAMRPRTLPLNAIVSLLALGSTNCVLITPVDDVVDSRSGATTRSPASAAAPGGPAADSNGGTGRASLAAGAGAGSPGGSNAGRSGTEEASLSASPATPRCSKFATDVSEVYEFKSRDEDGEWRLDSEGRASSSCSFDKAQLTYTCTRSDSGEVTTSIATWRSLSDAVIEDHPIGKITTATQTTDPATPCLDREYSYDPGGRLTTVRLYSLSDTSQCTLDSVWTYNAWETEGRPLVGTDQDMSTIEAEVCRTSAIAFNYDDGRGVVTRSITGSKAADCRSFVSTETLSYDADGLLVSTLATRKGLLARTGTERTTSTTRTLTNRATSTICE